MFIMYLDIRRIITWNVFYNDIDGLVNPEARCDILMNESFDSYLWCPDGRLLCGAANDTRAQAGHTHGARFGVRYQDADTLSGSPPSN